MKTLQASMLLLLLLLLAAASVDAYLPVFVVHGIFRDSIVFTNLIRFINKVHPGTKVVAIDNFAGKLSLAPMKLQVEGFGRVIAKLMKKYPDGIHLICFSQGALSCRGVLSTMPDHNVHTFIALAGPLAGLYGDPDSMTRLVPGLLTKKAHLLCYNKPGQLVSICNYWNDPFHRASYLRNNNFLPVLNGEVPHENIEVWKKNFLRIKKLVLIGGPDDGTIIPWQSSFFGFYDRNKNIIEMRDQKFYKEDSFGLKTLHERGDISMCLRSGVEHPNWPDNFPVFLECMERFLT